MFTNQLRRIPRYLKRGSIESKGWGVLSPQDRKWEEAYRLRWQFDKVVRSTHGVNCTGSCSWKIYVKGGIVTWETQQTDYPSNGPNMPEYEPRGCPRGASFSWYLYSPLRIKYPYIRSDLWKLWNEAISEKKDEVLAWQSIVEDPEKSRIYKSARGKGGFIRISHEDAFKIISSALIYTIKRFGPDRVFGFTPIPAMSMVSYASGTRFLSLIGGVIVSFYDWYCDLPPASPMIWGEQTDVPESADWYNSMYIIIWGANLPITRTPDAHFMVEARYKGTKVVVISPDYSDHVKFGDVWIPVRPGKDAALALAMVHVILKEFYVDKNTSYFINYVKKYTDLPFLVVLEKINDKEYYVPKNYLVASDLNLNISNAEWKGVVWDSKTDSYAIPNGSIGFRWDGSGKWNLKLEYEGKEIDPVLTFIERPDAILSIAFPYFDDSGNKSVIIRGVPAKKIEVGDKEFYVTTVFDLLLAHIGISRNLPGDYPQSYEDLKPYTPAWQESITGVSKNLSIQIAREFAKNAELTQGKSMVIMGSGINHWYHADLIYRAIITMILLTGSQGKNGGGWAHYVGQEKVRPLEGWTTVAFALDWIRPPRQQNGTSFFYFATDQWRYEESNAEFIASPIAKKYGNLHFADYNVLAVRLGWLPFYPQFSNKNPIDLAKEFENNKEGLSLSSYIAKKLKEGELKFAIEDPDNFDNVPKILFVWRANILGASGKGHEYFLKHLLGASNAVLEKESEEKPKFLNSETKASEGKLDLLVDINFRMDGTALYSDIVLPAATWYEKYDLSSTDLHPFVHPFMPAVDPLWESMSDWDTFKNLAKVFSEMASKYLPEKVKDIVASPLLHDTPDEISQPKGEILDWKEKKLEPIPGKTTQKFSIVERNYSKVYEMMTSLGPTILKEGIMIKGVKFIPKEEYEKLKNELGVTNEGFVKMNEALDVANVILTLSGATNGSIALKGWEDLERKTGLHLKDLIEGHAEVRYSFKDLIDQPRRVLTTPVWSGIEREWKQYTAFAVNVEKGIPWRTFTGRQQIFLDHELIREFGELLPTYKPPLNLPPITNKEILNKIKRKYMIVRWITPHNKWSIHTTYADNIRMLTLFRGGPVIWLNNEDAKELGIKDNDWIEAFNKNGVMVARAVISNRIPKGSAFTYHAFDRTINIPTSNLSGLRGGLHNSLTKIRVKPIHMIGGYAQFSYSFNYWGPTGNQRDSIAIITKLEEVDWG